MTLLNKIRALQIPEMRMEAVLKKDILVPTETPDDATALNTRTIKAGTRVRVWASSRFGGVGISDNLADSCSGSDTWIGCEANPGPVEDWLEQVWVRLD